MSVRVADSLRSECQCQPHGLARDALFSMGHVNGTELLIAELSQIHTLHFKASGQRSQQFGFSFKVQEHAARPSGEPHAATRSAVGLGKWGEGEGSELLSLRESSVRSRAAVYHLPESEANDT